jgi:dolichol-phosphate mannosyltransferase
LEKVSDATDYRHPELTIVLPTFNEQKNIEPMLRRIEAVLNGVRWDVVFVDDESRDGTVQQIFSSANGRRNVRIIRRIGRRGLSTAVVEGALSSMANYIAVMDADMQHDETVLPNMLDMLRSNQFDLVVGTRYQEGGGTGDWSPMRIRISRFATRIAQTLTGVKLTDPMSGYFMITRTAFESVVRRLSGQGFKILLDIATSSSSPLRIAEQPFHFRSRQFGESKLDTLVAVEFGSLVIDKLLGKFIPPRFVMFAMVGGIGLLLHMTILAFFVSFASFSAAQTTATVLAMFFNFMINNQLTYRDRRLKGVRQLTLGLLSFIAACSVGAFANVGIAVFVFEHQYSWWLSGLAGVAVGAVWNYAVTSVFTWKSKS